MAQLAGVPREVIAAAREYLAALEKGGSHDRRRLRTTRARADARAHRAHAAGPTTARAAGAHRRRIRACSNSKPRCKAVSADDLTPRAALDLIYKLRALLG